MKKIKREKSFDCSYLPVVVWLDDLSEIFDAIKDASEGQEVTIQTDDYEFQSVEELKEHFGGRTLTKLEILKGSPLVFVKFDTGWVKLYIPPRPNSARLFIEIDRILSRCQRKPSILYNGWLLAVLAAFNFAFGFTLDRLIAAGQPLASIGFFIFGLIFTWSVWAGIHRGFRMTVIRLQRRHEAKPFFERNRDQLLMLVIGTAIGILATFGGVVLKERFYPSSPVMSAPKGP